ncbi:DUF2812 domain-containing protein [Falsibacillus pallidus]|uniref:DUF2812 domain-containing protein n=1 Tax=Falsibacillus pallidus TaxID=493781 RepID=UPI003D96E8B2
MEKVAYRFYLDDEKEEKWINEMAAQGWHLKKFSLGRFTFTKGEPGAFVYRNEFVAGKSSMEKKDYFEFLKDSGIAIVHEFGGWVYMKKPGAEGPFELYTDTSSKIGYYKRKLNNFLILFFINALMGAINISFLGDGSMTQYINSSVGIMNIAAALLIAVPTIKVIQRKRELNKSREFFE